MLRFTGDQLLAIQTTKGRVEGNVWYKLKVESQLSRALVVWSTWHWAHFCHVFKVRWLWSLIMARQIEWTQTRVCCHEKWERKNLAIGDGVMQEDTWIYSVLAGSLWFIYDFSNPCSARLKRLTAHSPGNPDWWCYLRSLYACVVFTTVW